MNVVFKVNVRVVGDRVVARIGDLDTIVGHFVRCPCCGVRVDFRSAT